MNIRPTWNKWQDCTTQTCILAGLWITRRKVIDTFQNNLRKLDINVNVYIRNPDDILYVPTFSRSCDISVLFKIPEG